MNQRLELQLQLLSWTQPVVSPPFTVQELSSFNKLVKPNNSNGKFLSRNPQKSEAMVVIKLLGCPFFYLEMFSIFFFPPPPSLFIVCFSKSIIFDAQLKCIEPLYPVNLFCAWYCLKEYLNAFTLRDLKPYKILSLNRTLLTEVNIL